MLGVQFAGGCFTRLSVPESGAVGSIPFTFRKGRFTRSIPAIRRARRSDSQSTTALFYGKTVFAHYRSRRYPEGTWNSVASGSPIRAETTSNQEREVGNPKLLWSVVTTRI